MSPEENHARSAARAHLSQLIGIFGSDGCLRINTAPEPEPYGPLATPEAYEPTAPEDDERT
ncbi:hypothetical protein DVA86_32110 [Streptomyces armeniacus]|uniref:Uncharacterized protein n=1 Tax=Streptomyces armeniacus TaxID=83291 RepID=A0A345XY18_9ACTN|nr:hypothetical protein [Streptomyces armeniacus]AXK36534.1 hypothetical protein DVA86_32110 [Streptomyces armeniacus]